MFIVIYGALFCSGCSALVYEIVWQRLLVRLLGSTLPAVTIVFCLFMAGLAAGALWSIKLASRSANPIQTYAKLELASAIFGYVIPFVFAQAFFHSFITSVGPFLASSANMQTDSLAALSLTWSLLTVCLLAAIFMAALLMGATLNLAIKSLTFCGATALSSIERSLAAVPRLNWQPAFCYSLNLFGGASGSVLAAFLLIPQFGLTVASEAAAALNLLVAISLFWLTKAVATASFSSADQIQIQNQNLIQVRVRALFLAFAYAFISMGLEVAWTRFFALTLGSSTYAIATVVSMVLVGLALGSALALFLARRLPVPDKLIAFAGLLAATTLAASLFLLPRAAWLVLWLQQALLMSNGFAPESNMMLDLAFILPRFLITLLIVLPPATCLGLIFPLLLADATPEQAPLTFIGQILAASTGGSIFGALFVGVYLIPHADRGSGIELCFLLSIWLLVGLSLTVAFIGDVARQRARAGVVLFVCLGVLPLVMLIFKPEWDKSLMSAGACYISVAPGRLPSYLDFVRAVKSGSEAPLFYHEGLNSTITVQTNRQRNVIFLKSNGQTESALPIDWQKEAPTSDARTQILLGAVPIVLSDRLDNNGADKQNSLNALLIGLGSGITAGTMLASPQIKRLEICEIEPAVLSALHFFDRSNFQPLREDWLRSCRLSVAVEDGRKYLNGIGTKFDVIVSQPSEPWITGSSDLYTEEFWQLAKSKLTNNGLFCQWLQLYAIDRRTLISLLATFHSVFPSTVIFQPAGGGDILLVGFKNGEKGSPLENQALPKRQIDQINQFDQLDQSGLWLCLPKSRSNRLPTGKKICC